LTKSRRTLEVRLARSEADILAAQRLRYKVFVEELGAAGSGVDHERKVEADHLDGWFEHLLLIDTKKPAETLDHVVGAYRLLRSDVANEIGGFYSSNEFDLTPLLSLDRPLVELGRTCVHPSYRGGASMFMLWNGLAKYVLDNGISIMFGSASFHGTDLQSLVHPLSYLHHRYLAPSDLRVTALQDSDLDLELLPEDDVDDQLARKLMPPLIKAYLQLGGFVGDGVYLDQAFNTVDVCLLIDTERMNARRRTYYEKNWSRN